MQRQLGVPLEDLPLALAATLAVAGTLEALNRPDEPRTAIFAGGMLAAALAIRWEGCWLAASLLSMCGYAAWSAPAVRRESLLVAGRLLLAAVAMALPWWLCGGARLDFAGSPNAGQTLARLGPLLVIALGGIVFARRVRGMNRVVFVLATFVALAIVAPWPMSWWAIAVPLASVAAAWVWCERYRLPPPTRRIATAVSVVLAIAGLGKSVSGARDTLAVATARESRHEFLLRREPTYRAASLLNQIGRGEQRLFSQDPKAFYFSCLTASQPWPRATTLGPRRPLSERELIAWADAAGFAYLLLAERLGGDSSPRPPAPPTIMWPPAPTSPSRNIAQPTKLSQFLNTVLPMITTARFGTGC